MGLFNVSTGRFVGEAVRTSDVGNAPWFAPDGAWFIIGSGADGYATISDFRIWDTNTRRPLSRVYSTAEILPEPDILNAEGNASVWKGDGSRFALLGFSGEAENDQSPTTFLPFTFPNAGRAVPGWFADLMEAVGGLRCAESGAVEVVDAGERRRQIARIRLQTAGVGAGDAFGAFAQWWLDESPGRRVSQGSDQTVADYVARRLAANTETDLSMGMEAAPDHAPLYTKMAGLLRKQAADAGKDPDILARADYFQALAKMLEQAQSTPARSAASVNPTASLTHADDLFARAQALEKGDGVRLDFAAAAKLYRESADKGQAAAEHRLGVMAAKGEGMPVNDAEAVAWYRKAAEHGLAEAQYDLGVRYILGKGVAKDERIGIEWYRKAGAQGYAEAIDALRNRGLWK